MMMLLLNDTYSLECKSITQGTKENNLFSLGIFVTGYNQEVFNFLSSNNEIWVTDKNGQILINHLIVTNYIFYNEDKNFYSIEGRGK